MAWILKQRHHLKEADRKHMAEKTSLFTGKSDNYSRYRPGYPEEILNILGEHANLSVDSVIADIGSGTGILSGLFLRNGYSVTCVEPNEDMRMQASKDLGDYAGFHSINGTAEDSGIAGNSVDLIVCGQSFHWLDSVRAGKEFRRILKLVGHIVLIWNDRVQKTDGMNSDYERICRRFSPGYHSSGSTVLEDGALEEFLHDSFKAFTIGNTQSLNLEGLMGRYMSAFYAIGPDDPEFPRLESEFRCAFDRNQEGGAVRLEYETKLFLGKIV